MARKSWRKSVRRLLPLGDFLTGVYHRDHAGLAKQFGPAWEKAALSSAAGPTGGYLIPQDVFVGLMDTVAEEAIFRRGCDVVGMESESIMLSYPDMTTVQTAGVAPFFGGIQMKWNEVDTQGINETEPTFRMLELKSNLLNGYAVLSNTLLADANYLGEYLAKLFVEAIAWYEDYAFFQGSGNGQPTGILNAKATIQVTRNTSNQFVQQDAAAMLAKLIPYSAGKAVWAFSPTVWAALTTSTNNWGAWVFDPIRDDGSVASIFGHSAYVTEKLPALGTTGDVMLFDPRLYVIGERQEIRVDFSQEVQTQYLKNQSVLRVVRRVDGQPWLNSSVTLQDGSTPGSAYVALH